MANTSNPVKPSKLRIKVFGIGGAGGNTVNKLWNNNSADAKLYVANTDNQSLYASPVQNKIFLGTSGIGAGGNPEKGHFAAVESKEIIRTKMMDTDLVFITAGMGGGTGTGAAPVFAKIAKSLGCMVVSVVTRPFDFEGRKRTNNTEKGIKELSKYSDSIMVISNNRVLDVCGHAPFKIALGYADNVLSNTIDCIINTVSTPSLVNIDYADIKSILFGCHRAYVGIGMSDNQVNEQRAEDAALRAVNSPLLETDIQGVKNAIVHIAGGRDMCIADAEVSVESIKKAAGEAIDVIFGVRVDPNLDGKMVITVIATSEIDDDEDGAEDEKPKGVYSIKNR